MYHTGSDVLGVLIARASGQPFETFLHERIFEPLGMKDTAFSEPASKLDRLATSYLTNSQNGTLELYDPAGGGHWSRPPAFPSGGGALVSTVDDYLAFGRMMLNQGRHGSGRLLSRTSPVADVSCRGRLLSRTSPVADVCRDDDDGSPDRGAKSRIGPASRRFRQHWAGVRRGRRHPAPRRLGAGR